MSSFLRAAIVLFILAAPRAWPQAFSDTSLNGRYYLRHVQLSSLGTGIAEARSLAGSVTFDGKGSYSLECTQTVNSAAGVAFRAAGTYSVTAGGVVTMSHPQRAGAQLNLRLGDGALIGSTTETTGLFDLFIAIPAPASASGNASLSGSYWVTTLEFPSGQAAQARNTFFRLTANGQGGFGEITVSGAARNLGPAPTTQLISGATYQLNSEGAGRIDFPNTSGSDDSARLLAGTKALFLSAGGNLLLGGATSPGGQDILIGVRAMEGAGSASWKGQYWGAGLRMEGERISTFTGAANSLGQGQAVWTRRVRTSSGPADFTGTNYYSLNTQGAGFAELSRLALGASGRAFLGAGATGTDADNYEVYFGIRIPTITGAGVFLHPLGVLNAAGFAPGRNPIAPGEFITLYGERLAARTEVAAGTSFPATLAGVEVLVNNQKAPLYYVSPTQISALAPYTLQGPAAAIVVNNNGERSNTVDVPVAPSAPGVFTVPPGGVGAAAALHPDYTLVTPSKPVRRGGVVQIYLTGLGAVTPPVPDGAPAPVNPLSLVNAPVTVYVGGRPATVEFKGLAPAFSGLYQLNVRIPADAPTGSNVPLAIETPGAFHDQADIAVAP